MSGWIKVEDELPDDLAPVIGYFETWGVCVCTYDERAGAFVKDTSQADLYDAEPLSELDDQPTHWQPIPNEPNA